jgi:hypothetical protein
MIRRRDLFLAVTAAGAAAAMSSAASSNPTAAVSSRRDKRKAQYQANSPEVQAFYRVNQYPAKR